MYYPNERHRVFFNGVDLEEGYKLITSEKPIVSPPEAKTEYVEILGADGLLDLTEGVDGVPHFNNRELVLHFIVRPDVDIAWVMHNLITYYHNRRVAIRLPDDDPFYIYTGRITLDPAEHDGHYHRITMTANINTVAAYKMEDEYIQVPAPGGDDYMIDVPAPGIEDGWVKVPAPGGGNEMIDVPAPGGWVQVPAPGMGSEWIQVPAPGGAEGEMVWVPSPGGPVVNVPAPGGNHDWYVQVPAPGGSGSDVIDVPSPGGGGSGDDLIDVPSPGGG